MASDAFLALGTSLFVGFLALPTVALVLRIRDVDLARATAICCVSDALRLSLLTSTAAAGAAAVLGAPVAFVLARRSFPGKGAVEAIVQFPLLVPPVVSGMTLLLAFGRAGLLGPTLRLVGIELPYTTWAVIVAEVYVCSPFFIQAARGGLEAIPRRLEEASYTLGVSPLGTFLRVTLPLSWPGWASGILLAWGRAMGEFGATVMFAGSRPGVTQTMPLAVYQAWQISVDSAMVLSVILIAFSVLVFAIGRMLIFRRLSWRTGEDRPRLRPTVSRERW